MRYSRIILAGSAVGGAIIGRRSLRRRFNSWSTNFDATNGVPEAVPPGEEIAVTASDGAKLRGLTFGDSDGQVVMLVHCWTGTIATWGPVIHRLVDDGYRVVAVNQRGHGNSERGTAAYRPETLGADVATWIGDLDLRDIVLAGHSMGGLAGMAFVIDHPDLATERVRGLVLVATLASPPRPPRLPEFKADLTRLLPIAERALRARNYGLLGLLGIFGQRPARVQLEAARDMFLNTDPVTRAEAVAMMSDFDLRPDLPGITMPTRVVAGSHDYLTYLPMNQAIADLIPRAEIDVVATMGHMLPWEAPDRVTDNIVQAAKPVS